MRWPVKVKILIPGRVKFSFVKEGVWFYQERLKHYLPFELQEKKISRTKDASETKQLEGQALLKGLSPGSFKIALDERGVLWDSLTFARKLEELLTAQRELNFLIGGAFGLDEEVLKTADLKLSLSKLTLNHEIALLVLLEQLYRALTIVSGEPYHK
ncbi:MAG: 23S rRNA (pseudouridine(1915)-N(3))-methyltransferase RlmH [Thermodesulfobacteria bacterium]|nr:23S rRNA (pseudouridine(1915)-N(3))-methyltransferase RlmH [Thermodesulfobacteriota bacterium]